MDVGTKRVLRAGVGAAAICAAMTGCTRTVIKEPLSTGYDPADAGQVVEFWHALPGRAAVSNDEGLHGLIMLEKGTDELRTYEARVAYAKEQEWVGEGWDEAPDLAMQRGTAARALVQICEIEGGVMMRLMGPNDRNALREMVYLGVMPGSTPNQTMTGEEFMGIIAKAEDYMRLRDFEEAEEAKRKAEDAEKDGEKDGEKKEGDTAASAEAMVRSAGASWDVGGS